MSIHKRIGLLLALIAALMTTASSCTVAQSDGPSLSIPITNTYKQILTFLETLQEFVDTNPNEVAVLADSALLMQAIYADLNPQDVASRDKTSADARILRLLDTMQEFIDTNPNEVTALAESNLLIQAIHADLNPKDLSRGELRPSRIGGIAEGSRQQIVC